MEKLVQCLHWKEYQGLNGWVMFCSAGAFAKQLSKEEAKQCGCTIAQRATCKKIMESNLGYGLVPDILEGKKAATQEQKAASEL
ncbi:MAG TPA: hypothetical protein PKV91_08685 [Bacillota bacterium]|jgi:hypothetical protein|nr:hypothetical protein [Bacillota bacterium]HOA36348.1 hypothetical protein [Bacillota bacterium]HOJ84476.1 hypothetical protein [Bacillota bacterium]HOL15801.1 hypothetical protein [Bacillota bacterium]HPZ12411.1 hypothetical protein [Bacillota bacterium]